MSGKYNNTNKRIIEIKDEYSNIYFIVIGKISAIKYVDKEKRKGCIFLDSKETICNIDFSYLDKIVEVLKNQ